MLVPKQLIDNYDIISPIGGGGGSNIFKALSKKTKSFVCLKQIFFDTESKKKTYFKRNRFNEKIKLSHKFH